MKEYDLIVIGSGPGGEKAAVKAAYFLKKVAIIEKSPLFGGTATYYTVPSKALKELAVKSQKQKMVHGNLVKEFVDLKGDLAKNHSKIVLENLTNHGVDVYHGTASFVDANHIEILSESGKTTIQGKNIIIAGGVKTILPDNITIDGDRVHIVETIFNIKRIPSSICISGAGVIGSEFATIFSHLGTKVYLTDERPKMLGSVDGEIVNYLINHMVVENIDFHLGKKIKSIVVPKSQKEDIVITFENNGEIKVDMLLIVGRRRSQIIELNPQHAGIEISKHGMIPVNEFFQTNVPNIYAVGDTIGPPSLVNTSMDQGRYAVSHMFGLDDMKTFSDGNMPHGIYTIPEISTVGINEDEARKQGIDIIVGRAFHSDLARGMIRGVEYGMLKLIIDKSSRTILGVNIIGDQASELIHYGVDLVINKKNLSDIISSNFNYPSLHELYKYAAYNGLSEITGRHMRKHRVSERLKY
jgi:NAD(P) transhydrogenase